MCLLCFLSSSVYIQKFYVVYAAFSLNLVVLKTLYTKNKGTVWFWNIFYAMRNKNAIER